MTHGPFIWDKLSGHFSIILNYRPGDHDHGHHDHDHGAGHHDHSSGGPPPAPAFAPPAPLGYTPTGTGFGSDSYSSPGSVDSYDAPVAPNAYDEPFTNFVQVNLRLISLLKRLFVLFNDLINHISVPFLQPPGLGSTVNSDDTFVNPVNSVANDYDEAFPNLLQVIT